MSKTALDMEQVNSLLYQSLETEIGGVEIYKTAIRCAVNKSLKEEWAEHLRQTMRHVELLMEVLNEFGLDPAARSPERDIVHYLGGSFVRTMELALKTVTPGAAQIVAAECVVLAETKDHQNWELMGRVMKAMNGSEARALKAANDEVEPEEAEHLYHTTGWTRELWIESLGLAAVLPPPEEVKKVEAAIGVARAKQAPQTML